MAGTLQRTFSVARKELLHILRDPMTLSFTLIFPIAELFMLGYAIDTNVRDIPTVVFDQAGTQESRALLQKFENSGTLKIIGRAFSDEDLSRTIARTKAHVAIKIPEDYSRRLLAGQDTQVLVLVDGTVSTVAAEAVNVGNALALQDSLARTLGDRVLPVENRPRILYNPDTRSPNFFVPGLLVIMCQLMATMLAAGAVVKEKEIGTLEQLFMTPVRPLELLVGKMLPYVVLTVGEFCMLASLMWLIFQVPIHGNFLTLLSLSIPFILTMVGLGLLISTKASTRDAASQMTIGTILPSVFLSGYVFPSDTMPQFFQYLGLGVPATWLIDASRGVILRGNTYSELWLHAVVLWGMGLSTLILGALKFRNQVG
jgi:ABC-2 type transport system permease protein